MGARLPQVTSSPSRDGSGAAGPARGSALKPHAAWATAASPGPSRATGRSRAERTGAGDERDIAEHSALGPGLPTVRVRVRPRRRRQQKRPFGAQSASRPRHGVAWRHGVTFASRRHASRSRHGVVWRHGVAWRPVCLLRDVLRSALLR